MVGAEAGGDRNPTAGLVNEQKRTISSSTGSPMVLLMTGGSGLSNGRVSKTKVFTTAWPNLSSKIDGEEHTVMASR